MTKKLRLEHLVVKSLMTSQIRGGNGTERTKTCQTQIWQECSWICPTNLPEDC